MNKAFYASMITNLTQLHKFKRAVYVFFFILAFRPHENGFWMHQNATGFQKRSPEYIVQSGNFRKRLLVFLVWTDEKLLR